MLTESDAITMIAVNDLAVAKRFYTETLGLSPVDIDHPEYFVGLRSGKTRITLYTSEHAGTNKATTAMWFVGDEIDSLTQTLREKGVVFEHYDMPGTERQGDIYVFGDVRVAWFKDPDGNILSIQNH